MNTSHDFGLQHSVEAAIAKHAHVIDAQKFLEWPSLFTEDGVYSAIDFENFADQGLTLFTDRGREALEERAAFWLGMWQTQRAHTVHIVSNTLVAPGQTGEVLATSKFVSLRTDRDGVTKLYAAGDYRDVLVEIDDCWLFKRRQVILASTTLPASFTDAF